MKRFLLLCVFIFVAGCDDDDNEKGGGRLNPFHFGENGGFGAPPANPPPQGAQGATNCKDLGYGITQCDGPNGVITCATYQGQTYCDNGTMGSISCAKIDGVTSCTGEQGTTVCTDIPGGEQCSGPQGDAICEFDGTNFTCI